jgi:hypothetical protein
VGSKQLSPWSLNDSVWPHWLSPSPLEILLPIVRHVTTFFPDPVDDMCLGHEVPLPERQQPLQLVGQQFTADVDPEHPTHDSKRSSANGMIVSASATVIGVSV